MLVIIFSWVFLFLVILLVGNIFLNKKSLSCLGIDSNFEWFEYFWVGLALVLAILQIWSIFLPVNIYSLIFIIALSLTSLIILLKKQIKLPKISIYYFLIIGAIFFTVSYFASLSVNWPDTQGYHLNVVKWTNLYPAVPGLANLHSRLGFNSSFFLFASMIDSLLNDRSSHIALSLMVSVLLAEYVWLFIKSKDKYLKVFLSLTLPVIVVNIIRTGQISSLSYDFALLILILITCIELIKNSKTSLFIAGIISMILLTVKLSGAAFSLVVTCYVAYKLFVKNRNNICVFWIFVALGILFFIPYITRDIILSGWPFYPLPILGLNFTWTVSVETVRGLFETIKAWAILPGGNYTSMIGVPVWKWLPGWISRNVGSFELKSFAFSLVVPLLSFVFKFIDLKKVRQNSGSFIIFVASLFGILYLITSAPDFRFGSVFFWIFFASSMSFVFVELFKKCPNFEKTFFVLPLLLIYYIAWPPKFEGGVMLKSIRWEQAWTFDKIIIVPSDGSPSFRVYIPGETGSCGNSQLPCTPEYKNDFKEIVPGDISKGFASVR